MRRIILSCLLILPLAACVSAKDAGDDVADAEGDRITAGTVQREIRVGMSSADVVQALGAPNMVTTDENRREVWVYDKISTRTVSSSRQGGIAALILTGAAHVATGGGASYSRKASATSSSQKTLTVIVKFDKDQKVRDFSYRQTSF